MTKKAVPVKFVTEDGGPFFNGLGIPFGKFFAGDRHTDVFTIEMAHAKLAAAVEAGLCTKDEATKLEEAACAVGIFADVAAICAHVAGRGEAAIAAGEVVGDFSFRLCDCGASLPHGSFFKGDRCMFDRCMTQEQALGWLDGFVNQANLTPVQAAILFKQVVDAGVLPDEEAGRLVDDKDGGSTDFLSALIGVLVRRGVIPAKMVDIMEIVIIEETPPRLHQREKGG